MPWWVYVFWCISALVAATALYVLHRALFHDRARARRRCPRCWYDMAGVPDLTCPECGRFASSEWSLGRTRRHYGRVTWAAGLAFFAWIAAREPYAIATGSWLTQTPDLLVFVIAQVHDDYDGLILSRATNRTRPGATPLGPLEGWLIPRYYARLIEETGFNNSGSAASKAGPELTEVLRWLGPKAQSAIPALLRAARNPKNILRQRAMFIIGQMREAGAPAVPTLAALLATDPTITREILQALSDIGPKAAGAMPAVQKVLRENDDESVRLDAIVTVYSIAYPREIARDALIENIHDDSRVLRCAVIDGFERLNLRDEQTHDALADMAQDPDWLVGGSAAALLRARWPADPPR